MFNPRQLLVHGLLLRAIEESPREVSVRDFALGIFQQYLRNQNMFSFWNPQGDKLEPFLSNPHYHPKQLVLENGVFGSLGRGNWQSSRATAEAAAEWCLRPWEKAMSNGSATTKSIVVAIDDPIVSESAIIDVRSSTELEPNWENTLDAVITDPPFGDNLFYGDLSNFFYVWLRLALKDRLSRPLQPRVRASCARGSGRSLAVSRRRRIDESKQPLAREPILPEHHDGGAGGKRGGH